MLLQIIFFKKRNTKKYHIVVHFLFYFYSVIFIFDNIEIYEIFKDSFIGHGLEVNEGKRIDLDFF